MVSVLRALKMELPTLNPTEEDGEILEDGEIDDEEIIEEVVEEKIDDASVEGDNKVINAEDDGSNDEKKKKKKHRHKKSEERKRRKRKKHDQNVEDENGSPQGKKRKKRKKHAREESSPESDLSSEYSRRSTSIQRYDTVPTDNYDYYSYGDVEYDQYGKETLTHKTSMSKNNADSYINETEYYDETLKDDFESQLADYQKYKTSGSSINQLKNSDQYSEDDSSYYNNQPNRKRNYNQQTDRNKSSRARNQQHGFNRQDSKTTSHRSKNQSKVSRWNSYDNQNQSQSRQNRSTPEQSTRRYDNHNEYEASEYSSQHDDDEENPKQKKHELCKYYLQGHCHHGSSCSYMHEEYPCKYFHTGAQCYAKDGCRFSHEPMNEDTREIIEKLQEVYNDVDDSWEIDELRKEGITPNPKPPPGRGLLPTPHGDVPTPFQAMMAAVASGHCPPPNFPPPPPNHFLGIPSLFDINVVPTPEFQEKIDRGPIFRAVREMEAADMLLALSEVPSLTLDEYDSVSSKMHLSDHETVTSESEQNDANVLNQCSRTPPWLRNNDPTIQEPENNDITSEINHTTDEEIKAPDFLPAKQKELFMRIHHKGQTQEAMKENTSPNKIPEKEQANEWSYSSDEENVPLNIQDSDVIKIDSEEVATPTSSNSAVQSIVNMISNKNDSTLSVDKNLLSKVASVIDMAGQNSSVDSSMLYTPTLVPTSSYAPKESPKHHSSQRERKSSNSSSGSGSHRVHHHHPLRKRISTQELNKEPVSIPLVAKEDANSLHSAHPDPRMSLSRFLGAKKTLFLGEIPPFCKEILLGSGKLVGLKITLSSEGKTATQSTTKRSDPRLSKRADPRTAKSSDPRIRRKHVQNSSNSTETEEIKKETKTVIPQTPPALITKTSSIPIPSLSDFNLDLALAAKNAENQKTASKFPTLQMPKLKKAPIGELKEEPKSILANNDANTVIGTPPPTIAPYDPRYMSGNTNTTVKQPTLTTAPYDPRSLSSTTSYDDVLNTKSNGADVKKRTIQLPKLTLAPTFKQENNNTLVEVSDVPAGDQGDF